MSTSANKEQRCIEITNEMQVFSWKGKSAEKSVARPLERTYDAELFTYTVREIWGKSVHSCVAVS